MRPLINYASMLYRFGSKGSARSLITPPCSMDPGGREAHVCTRRNNSAVNFMNIHPWHLDGIDHSYDRRCLRLQTSVELFQE